MDRSPDEPTCASVSLATDRLPTVLGKSNRNARSGFPALAAPAASALPGAGRRRLVLFQLNRANRPDTGERMRGATQGPMAVPQIPVDAPAADAMAGVVGVRQRGALRTPKCASIRFSHEASVGVHTGSMRSCRSRARKRGWSWTLRKLSMITKSRRRG